MQHLLATVLAAILFATLPSAQWNVAVGGDAERSGASAEVGPTSPELLWEGSLPGIVAQQGVADGDLVVVNRIGSFVIPTGTWIVAHERATGEIRWQTQLPMSFPDAWRSRVTGIDGGRVYATRAGNTNAEFLYALSPVDGSMLWQSDDLITETTTESVTFAPDGDVITSGEVGGSSVLLRISRFDGTTVWSTPRSCPTSGGCDAVISGDRVYVFEASALDGPPITVFDLATGARLYSSDGLGGGFIQQVGPFAGPDGKIYAPRTANTPGADFLFALEDTGSELVETWSVPMGYVPFASHGIGPDGSIYSYDLDLKLMRVDPETGEVIDRSAEPITTDFPAQPRMAVDASGVVYVSNGRFADGRLCAYTPDLRTIWCEDVTNVNVGGPVMAEDGTLVVCGVGTDVRAYQTECQGYTVEYASGCSGTGGFTPSLAGAGCPEPGGLYTLSIADALGGASAFLAVGGGVEALAVVPGCEAAIAPVIGSPIPLLLPGAGPGAGDLDLVLALPAGLGVPLDLYLQVFVLDAGAPGGVAATGALQMHIQ